MPVKTLEEVTAQLSAEEKALLDKTFAKHPELKDGWLRQDEFSRRMTEFQTKEKDFEKEKTRNETLEAWAEVNIPKYDALVEKGIIGEDGTELWSEQKAELERQLEAAKLAGGEMDAAELDRRVKQIVKDAGVSLSREEMAALIANEGKKLAQETFKEEWAERETKFNEQTIPFVAGFAAANSLAAAKYTRETGKDWTADVQKDFYAAMSAKKNFDPFAVIDEFIAPIKTAKTQEETAAELERLRKENERLRTMPGGGMEDFIPQESQKGALQMMLEKSAEAGGDVEALVQAGIVKSAKELQEAR